MIRIAGVMALGLLASVPALAQMIQSPGTPAKGPYADPESGMTFPTDVGDFHRFRLTRGGDGISAGYVHALPDKVAVTLFVQRRPPGVSGDMCGKMAAAYREAIARDHPGASFADREAPPMPGYDTQAFSATVPDAPGGLNTGERYLYCLGDGSWLVEYDFQHPSALDAAPLEAGFLRDFKPAVTQKP